MSTVRRRLSASLGERPRARRPLAWACCALALLGLGAAPEGGGMNALPLELPEPLGQQRAVVAKASDTLLDIALEEGVGFDALQWLNPEVDVWMPRDGQEVVLPTVMLPPTAPRAGLVVNLPEMRMYDYTVEGGPRILPLAIGDPTSPSPIGEREVLWKTIDPVWRVPESIRAEHPWMPAEVPPGPDNPLGRYWLALGDGYGLHGTNNLWSIGRVATHGCIRLQNDQVEALYARIPVGTPVHLVYQTVKLGRQGDQLLLEAHPDVYERIRDPLAPTLVHLMVLGLIDAVDRAEIERVVREARGVPVPIGRISGAGGGGQPG